MMTHPFLRPGRWTLGRFAILGLLLVVLLAGTGCGTLLGVVGIRDPGHMVFIGTMVDAGALFAGPSDLFGIGWVIWPIKLIALADLPFSIAADTALLPITIPLAIANRKRGRSKSQPPEKVPRGLIETMKDEDPLKRQSAARELEAMKPWVMSALLKATKDKDPRVRHWVAIVLANRDLPYVPELIDALKGESREVRMEAVDILGKLGEDARSALPALREAAEEPWLRAAALSAIRRIPGKE